MKVNCYECKYNKYLKVLRYIIAILSLITFIGIVFLGDDTVLNGFILFICLILMTLCI